MAVRYYNCTLVRGKAHVYMSEHQTMPAEHYCGEITLRSSKIKIKLYGKIELAVSQIVCETAKERKYSNTTLLVSNLQKCIRRGCIEKALLTAYNIILNDPLVFLRRILIIAVEDVSVLKNGDFIAWLLMAYPNFEWSDEITQHLLSTVYALCISKRTLINTKHIVDISHEEYLRIVEDPVKRPLLIRMEYGGLGGDMRMLKNLLLTNMENTQLIPVCGKIFLRRYIHSSDILLESIDFHITKKMIPFIVHYSSIKDPAYIKKLVWDNNSSYNFRKISNSSSLRDWNKIKQYVSRYQTEYDIW